MTSLVKSAAHNLKMPPTLVLYARRLRELLRHAPPQLEELPDPTRDPDFFAHMFGIDRIENIQVQVFCVNFLAELKAYAFRAELFRNS